jgi:hypothetical protein
MFYGWYNVQSDSKLLSGNPFIGHGNPDNNLKSLCICNDLRKQGLFSLPSTNFRVETEGTKDRRY